MTEELVPAEMLLGLDLQGGWKVIEIAERGPKATGGTFSKGYIVENGKGTKAFLKALDFSNAFDSPDPVAELKELADAYIYERDLLYKCGEKRMTRVATPLNHGMVEVDSLSPLKKVQYIIFEMATGDSRVLLDRIDEFEVAWRLNALHNVTVGLSQLHQRRIAHQDVKPSNILFYEDAKSKVADLGRASEQGNPSPYEEWKFPGDWGYAPPELLYGHISTDWKKRRIGTDIYMLGSMIHFFFVRTNLTPTILAKIDEVHRPQLFEGTFSGPYVEVSPFVRAAWDEVIYAFEADIKRFHGAPGPALTEMLIQLTDPDPDFRGHPKDRSSNQFSLRRYVAQFNLLYKRHQSGRGL